LYIVIANFMCCKLRACFAAAFQVQYVKFVAPNKKLVLWEVHVTTTMFQCQ